MKEIAEEIWVACGFLTTMPVPIVVHRPDGFGKAARWFPLVGLALGCLLVVAQFLLRQLFSNQVSSVLVVILWAALTGGLHLDGLADCCDGLLASVSAERRLEILRDPRLGAFGVAGLALFLLLKVAAVAALVNPLPALILAPVWARWLLLVVARQRPARPDGLGATFAAGLTRTTLAAALVAPLLTLLIFGANLRGLLAVGVVLLVCFGVIRLAYARIGGVTGDVYGLAIELSEAAFLLVYAARLG